MNNSSWNRYYWIRRHEQIERVQRMRLCAALGLLGVAVIALVWAIAVLIRTNAHLRATQTWYEDIHAQTVAICGEV